MNNQTLLIKMQQRLNKLASNDYTNLECWQILELFHKGQVAWCRRNAHGENILKEGDESSTSRIDDLEKILTNTPPMTFTDQGLYFQSDLSNWPADYLRYKRIGLTVTKECCPKPKRMTVYLGEEANVDVYLDDPNVKPDYAWGQTFATITGNKLNIYHDNQFTIGECSLIHYRQPVRIQINGCRDPYTNAIPTVDVLCEFNDDLVEIFIDEAAKIAAGDTENPFQLSRLNKQIEENN